MRARPAPARLLDRFGLESRHDDEGSAGDDGACHDGEAADVRERQAGEPRVAGGVDAKPRSIVARADAATASCVRTTPLGWPDVPERRDDQGVAFLDGQRRPGRACCSPSEPTIRVGRSASSIALRAAGGSRGSERCGGVSGVPDGPECIDKPHATREVECDELGHRPVA